MLLKIVIILYVLSISSILGHDNKKKKTIKAHEHGVGVLKIAQENNTLVFDFEIPGSDIVGFEYEAKEEEDVKKVKNALNILYDYNNMILPSGSGECENIKSVVKVINEGKHSEFVGEYKFNCKNISALKRIYIKYFSQFELSRKLNIKIFGNNKKSAYVIEKPKKIINVKAHF